ncbi:MAG TPA: sigma-70 family RNA polymerase sigma factor [Gemmata sp.]|jgi:RNA polymerase sigma factor (sigma-70 family)|nr:sigma-70 family RNA polymerase sigma factor [Gemmata sp.]
MAKRSVANCLLASRFTGGVFTSLSDCELLKLFVETDDQMAFATVVNRHGAMVFGVCQRILHTQQDAEDVCQAVFLILSNKAKTLRWRESVANWLYTTARMVALNARRTLVRRTKRENSAAKPESVLPADTISGRELIELLDEELDKLAPQYREPLVLCYLEGLTRDEAATRLGVPEATLKSQLERGKRKLAKSLLARGYAVGIVLLASVTTCSIAKPSPRLRKAILATVDGSPSPSVVSFSQAVAMNGMFTKPSSLLAFVGLIALGVAFATGPTTSAEAPKNEPAKQAISLPRAAPVPKVVPTVAITVDNVKQVREVGKLARDAARFDWIPGSNEVAIIPWEGEIEVFDTRELKSVRTLGAGKQLVDFAFSRDGKQLAWSENNSSFTIENLKTGKQISVDTGRAQPSLTFSPDYKLLAAGGYGTEVDLWDVTTGKKIRDFESDLEGGLTPVFSPDGKILAVGNRNSDPRLFETSTGKLLHVLPKKMTQGIRFNPAGTILATAYVDGSIGLWDVETGKSLREEQTTGEELYTVDWSPKGDLLVTAGKNAKIIIWDAKELKPIKEIEAPEWVICARFSPDGSRIFTAGGTLMKSPDRKITIWGIENPK